MARRPVGKKRTGKASKAPASKKPVKMRVGRSASKRVAPAGVLESYRVTCSGCFEDFEMTPKEGIPLVCPLCEHESESPGKPFLEQMTRYTKREQQLMLKSVVPVVAAFVLILMWFGTLSSRSSVPRTGLTAAISESDTAIPVATTEGFPNSGTIIIGGRTAGEVISYEGKMPDKFTGAVREATDTASPSPHGIGEAVYSKGFQTGTTIRGVIYALLVVGLLGFGVWSGLHYEKARWTAYF